MTSHCHDEKPLTAGKFYGYLLLLGDIRPISRWSLCFQQTDWRKWYEFARHQSLTDRQTGKDLSCPQHLCSRDNLKCARSWKFSITSRFYSCTHTSKYRDGHADCNTSRQPGDVGTHEDTGLDTRRLLPASIKTPVILRRGLSENHHLLYHHCPWLPSPRRFLLPGPTYPSYDSATQRLFIGDPETRIIATDALFFGSGSPNVADIDLDCVHPNHGKQRRGRIGRHKGHEIREASHMSQKPRWKMVKKALAKQPPRPVDGGKWVQQGLHYGMVRLC